jgi:hypothetical protein
VRLSCATVLLPGFSDTGGKGEKSGNTEPRPSKHMPQGEAYGTDDRGTTYSKYPTLCTICELFELHSLRRLGTILIDRGLETKATSLPSLTVDPQPA